MSSSDLKYIFAIAIIAVLWGAFNFLWVTHSLDNMNPGYTGTGQIPGYSEQSGGIIGILNIATSWLNVLGSVFSQQTSFLYINLFVWPILGFGLLVIILRYIRGV